MYQYTTSHCGKLLTIKSKSKLIPDKLKCKECNETTTLIMESEAKEN